MDKIDNAKEEQKFDMLRSIAEHLETLYKKIFSEKNEKEIDNIDEIIVSSGKSEEEKMVLQEMCNEVDIMEERMKELRESSMETNEWFNKKIDDELHSVRPNITPEESDAVKEIILQQIEKDAEYEAEALDEEMEQTKEIAEGVKE